MLSQTVNAIGNVSKDMHTKLKEQGRKLERLDEDMDELDGTFLAQNEQLKRVIKESGGMKMFCFMVALCGIAFFLFLLVIYT